MRKILLALAVLILAAPTAQARKSDEEAKELAWKGCPGSDALTVFHDVSGAGRKNRAAKAMTERHHEMARQGYSFAGLAVYTENGDLEGFFLTYTRPVSCDQATAPAQG